MRRTLQCPPVGRVIPSALCQWHCGEGASFTSGDFPEREDRVSSHLHFPCGHKIHFTLPFNFLSTSTGCFFKHPAA